MIRRDLLSLATSAGLGFVLLRLTPACSLVGAEEEVTDPTAPTKKKRGAGASGEDSAEGEGVDSIDPGSIDARKPGAETPSPSGQNPSEGADAGTPAVDSGSPVTPGRTVTLYDTNAQALYFDGTRGPFTGVIKVDYVLANAPITIDFWHGHGGALHRYTLLPEHFAALKRLERVTLETTVVDGHQHKLFIDPVDPTFRVAGATGVTVPV